MTSDEKFEIEEFWLQGLRRLWIDSMDRGDITASEVATIDAELRELLEDYPPIKNGAEWNVAPLVYGLARKIGQDPDALLAAFVKSDKERRDERAAALETAEDLLRGE